MTKTERNARRSRGGFTLIEILLVVVIIGMLATVAAINIPKMLGKGREGKAKADISRFTTALHAYNMDEGKYPSSMDALTAGNDPIMESIPKDPWGRDYQYNAPSTHGKGLKFDVFSYGEDGVQSDDDIGNWNLDRKSGGNQP
jgi:general secretion pathway protein G